MTGDCGGAGLLTPFASAHLRPPGRPFRADTAAARVERGRAALAVIKHAGLARRALCRAGRERPAALMMVRHDGESR